MHAKVTPRPDIEVASADLQTVTSLNGARQATRPIRALSRGLEVLIELNRHERAPIHTLSSAVRLPRTTTFRILETLRLAGFVERDPRDDCYRPTVRVRALAAGFDDEAMVAHIAKRQLPALAAEIVWPLDIATPAGSHMLVRETSQSPLSIEPHGAGETVPMLTSAAGRAFLAFCAPKTREAVVDVLTQSQAPADRLARDRVALERLLQETRSQGFGLAQRARRVSEETSLALPIQSGEDVLAALSVRFAATAVPQRSAIEQFLPKMREFARAIEAEFSQTRR